jgi:hypothetical protein
MKVKVRTMRKRNKTTKMKMMMTMTTMMATDHMVMMMMMKMKMRKMRKKLRMMQRSLTSRIYSKDYCQLSCLNGMARLRSHQISWKSRTTAKGTKRRATSLRASRRCTTNQT